MNELTDQELLRDYAERQSEPAFSELVRRHIDLVYSAALRMVCDPHTAEDVTQNTFVALTKNALQVRDRSVLSSWLHSTARNLAANTIRTEVRRRAREQEAATMNELLANEPEALWKNIAPHLDDAIDDLGDSDRDALFLRYFERKSAREIGQIFGISEEAAQKRVSRAVERLRELFSKRGLAVGAGGLAVLISANAVQAAPLALPALVSTAALAGTTIHTSTAITATKAIAMTLFQKTLVTTVVAIVAAAGIYEAHQATQLRSQLQILRQQQLSLAAQMQHERNDAANQLADLATENARLKTNADNSELLKLRAEVARLNAEASDPALNSAKASARKVAQLKQRLDQKPAWKIPELQFISDKEWTDAAWDADLSTDDGVRDALSRVRETAINRFLNEMMKAAMKKYLAAHGNILPDNLNQLEPYFDVPVTDDMLARYKLLQNGQVDNRATLVRLAVNVDEDYDSNHSMSINGASGGRFNGVKQRVETAVMDYAVDHQGQMPISSSQISGYLQTPIEDVTIQKYLTQSLADPLPPDTLVLLPAVKAYTKANNGKMPANSTDLLPYITTDVQKAAIQKQSK